MKNYQSLKSIFKRWSDLQYLQRLLMWDEAVMMPEGAGPNRAEALATLKAMTQQIVMNKDIAIFLKEAKSESLNAWDAANLAWMEKIVLKSGCIPLSLTEAATKAAMASEQAWRQLRPKNDWQTFLPYLEKTFYYTKEMAERRSQVYQLSIYDGLLDDFAPGFNQATIHPLFDFLKMTLPALIKKIMTKQSSESMFVPQGPFSVEKQRQLGLEVMQSLGFDFNHGRLDVSHHPFCSGGPRDVRVTTRYSEKECLSALMGICHETGHALYEQGLPQAWLHQPVGQVDNMALHESQSLLIEMEVCRSPAFCNYLTQPLNHHLGTQDAFRADNLFKLLTRVKPSYIRVDADEVTYPLHIILRYDVERALFNNEITIKDLPAYWDERMQKYLGLSTKDNYNNGVMQDVHWPAGLFGYFPAYTLGRMIAAQLFATYQAQFPQLQNEFKAGNFQSLRQWLKENIHQKASSQSVHDLLVSVTGKPLDSTYFIRHLEARYLN